MGTTGIRGTQIKDETIESVDLASGSIKVGELNADAVSNQATIDSVDTTNDMLLIYDANNDALKKVAPTNLGVGGSGSPGGSDTQVQFNDGSSFGGDSGLTFNKTSGLLTVAKGAVFNEGSHDSDFRVESNDDANILFVNAGTNRIGIGTNAPTALLHISSSETGALFRIDHPEVGVDNPIFFVTGSSGTSKVGIGTETPDATFAISDDGKVLEVGSAAEGSWFEINNGTIYLNSGGGIAISGGDNLGQRFNIAPINGTYGALGIGKYPGATVNIVEVNSENSDQGGDFFVIDSDGQVGIGKTSPTSPLHVYSNESENYAALIDNDNSSSGHGLKVTSDGTGTGTNLLDVEAASTTVFRVRGDGRVGIGKVASLPDAMLTVSSSNTDSDLAIAHKIHHIGDSDTYIEFGEDEIQLAAGGRTFIKLDEGSTDKLIINHGALDIDLKVGGENQANLIRTDAANDRVGIATSSPSTLLDVSGSAKANTFVTTPCLTDLGSGTATHLTSSNGVHFLDADSVTLATGKSYHEIFLAPGSINGQHIQLAITSSANNPVKLMGDTGGDTAQGTVSFSGAPLNGQTVSFPNVGGGTTYTVTWDELEALGNYAIPDATNITAGTGGAGSGNDMGFALYGALDTGISVSSWPFTLVGTYGGEDSVTLSQTSAGTSGNQTITENSDNTTVTGFSGGTELVVGTINSTYGIALSNAAGEPQGAHLIYDSNSEQWQIIAGNALSS